MDNLAEGKRNDWSCNVAALLLMNAAMLHQRIAVGSWLPISNLSEIKNDANVVKRLCREWERIIDRDLNILRDCVLEAGRHLREDGLQSTLATDSKWITWPRASATTVAT